MMHSERGTAKEEADLFNVYELIMNCTGYDQLFEDYLIICKDLMTNNIFDTRDKESLMKSVEEYICTNISQPLSTKTLSKRFGLVAPYLSKLFKDYRGESPAQYIQNTRIEMAKKLLVENPNLLAKEIAEMLGYNDSLYFSKSFKKNVGVYPSEYRLKGMNP